jgi:3-isopropylmalate dehydratase small subunit
MRPAGQRPKVASASCAQGSSREHAVIAARHLCLPLVIARSCARIDWQKLGMVGVMTPRINAASSRGDTGPNPGAAIQYGPVAGRPPGGR